MDTLAKLRQYLSNTSKEEFDKHWEAVGDVGITGPTVDEFLSDFLQSQQTMVVQVLGVVIDQKYILDESVESSLPEAA